MQQNSANSQNMRQDLGPGPQIININRAAAVNPFYRRTLWTGDKMQVTLMSVPCGDEVGLECHPDMDQMIRIESGMARVRMGPGQDRLEMSRQIGSGFAILIPAGIWHNLINIGNRPLKVLSVYAPPHYAFGTVHETRRIAQLEQYD